MRKVLRSGFQKIEILKWYESDTTDTFMDFRDTFSALNFLRKFMHDHLNMISLRNALAEMLSYTSISRLTDHEILQQLAWQIVRGYVKIVPRVDEVPRVVLLGMAAEAAAEAAETEVVEAPAARRAPAAQTREPVVEAHPPAAEPVPVPSVQFDARATESAEPFAIEPSAVVHAEAQAATLKQAAQSGRPFCQKCEEAAKERAAAKAIPKEEPVAIEPSVTHAQAQAATLKQAAQSGRPFCQKCEEAARKYARLS